MIPALDDKRWLRLTRDPGALLLGERNRTKLVHAARSGRVLECFGYRIQRAREIMVDRNVLAGAKAIAAYFYGDPEEHRRVYNLLEHHREPHRFPMFKLGSTICARKSEIDRWIQEREKASNDNRKDRSDAA